MRILMINVSCGAGSTGRICTDLAASLEELGHEVKIAYGRDRLSKKFQKYAVKIGTDLEVNVHAVYARIFDASGLGSKFGTKKFIKWIKKYNPDIIHLHNIHGYYINIPLLFAYLKSCGKPIIWTLHDCWSFTGHTPYCDFANCKKWENGCGDCPLLTQYPISYIDRSKRNWKWKKLCFTNVQNLSLITPSKWLARLVKKSFLLDYDVKVIHNGIDTSAFFPLKNDFKKIYQIENKKILLSVVSNFDNTKEDFIRLSKLISNDTVIVLVVSTQEQLNKMPSNIIVIKNPNSIKEKDYIYNAADVFINLSCYNDYSMSEFEKKAYDIPVITYKKRGDKERKTNVIIVEKGNIKKVWQEVERVLNLNNIKGFKSVQEEKEYRGYFEEKKRRNLLGKYIILGVASVWDRTKGLDDFIYLHSLLPSTDYQIVLVGLSKKQLKCLPVEIIGIDHTESIEELRVIYSLADVFINPTVVDNYPTTNIEASCCGTPVITYRTGGSPESVPKSQVVEKNNVKHVKELIKNGNLKVIQRKDFDKSSMKEAYLNLYNSL